MLLNAPDERIIWLFFYIRSHLILHIQSTGRHFKGKVIVRISKLLCTLSPTIMPCFHAIICSCSSALFITAPFFHVLTQINQFHQSVSTPAAVQLYSLLLGSSARGKKSWAKLLSLYGRRVGHLYIIDGVLYRQTEPNTHTCVHEVPEKKHAVILSLIYYICPNTKSQAETDTRAMYAAPVLCIGEKQHR